MNTAYVLARPATAVSVALFLALVAGCSKFADQGGTSAAPAPSPHHAPASLVKVALKLGNRTAAKSCIKDLEVTWDSAEAGLKLRTADDWRVVEKAIGHALNALRPDAPSPVVCKAVLAAPLKTVDTSQGKI